jgi:iron complex transport system substrate-binding protein
MEMKGTTVISAAALLAVAAGCCCREGAGHGAAFPSRIISLAPSITETLFALGAGDKVVGVTNFCLYPPAVRSLPRVGGYTDPSYESILSLRPDFVVLLQEHEPVAGFLKANGIRYLTIDNHDIAGIVASIDTLGAICGVRHAADSLSSLLQSRFCRKPAFTGVLPRVLISVGRETLGSGSVDQIWVAGRDAIYSEVLDAAVARNAMSGSRIPYPTLSAESIIRLAPDIIIEITSHMPSVTCEAVQKDWGKLDMVPAVRDGLVFCLSDDYVTVPGPRIVNLLGDMKKIVESYHREKRPGFVNNAAAGS